MQRKTTISSDPINVAKLIDPASGRVISEGSTPTEIVARLHGQGRSLRQPTEGVIDETQKLKDEIEQLKAQLNK